MLIRCPHEDCRKYVRLTYDEAHKRKVLCPHCGKNLYALTKQNKKRIGKKYKGR